MFTLFMRISCVIIANVRSIIFVEKIKFLKNVLFNSKRVFVFMNFVNNLMFSLKNLRVVNTLFVIFTLSLIMFINFFVDNAFISNFFVLLRILIIIVLRRLIFSKRFYCSNASICAFVEKFKFF